MTTPLKHISSWICKDAYKDGAHYIPVVKQHEMIKYYGITSNITYYPTLHLVYGITSNRCLLRLIHITILWSNLTADWPWSNTIDVREFAIGRHDAMIKKIVLLELEFFYGKLECNYEGPMEYVKFVDHNSNTATYLFSRSKHKVNMTNINKYIQNGTLRKIKEYVIQA